MALSLGFQFHTGSIKSENEPVFFMPINLCFNSTLVRLKDMASPLSSCCWHRFNSTLVRLKDATWHKYRSQLGGFNSTLVRLKAGNW